MKREEDDKLEISRKPSATSALEAGDKVASEISNIRSTGGSALDASTKDFMGSRFGYDFGSVRIHTGERAARSARYVNALAYTVGNDVVFGEGQYQPDTLEGKRLLAHELTHVIQQRGTAGPARIQRDFAIAPPRPRAVGRTLTAAQIQAAIVFNNRRFTDSAEIALVRDILGLPRDPAVVDEDFVNAVALYQAQYGETSDGKVGPATMSLLAREVQAEGQFLTDQGAPRGSFDIAFALLTQLDGLISAGSTTYADYRNAIRAATVLNRTVALVDVAFMQRLRDTLTWNNFARSAELLGRLIPDGNALLRDTTVRATLAAAWTASNPAVTIWDTHDPNPALAGDPCNPAPGAAPTAGVHEEGGWVYLNVVTGATTTRRAAAGAQAGINLNAPPAVADSVIVATFHTHPNVGACWATAANPVFASPADIANANTRGVPNLIRGAFPAVANTQDIFAGPASRLHLAGSRLFPGAAGGLTPQANVLGKESELE